MKKNSPIPFFIAYFIFCILSNFVHPVTPAFLKSISAPSYVSGLAMSAVSFGMFIVSPLWGKLGDRSGYIKCMGLGYIGYALAQLLFSFSTTVPMVLLARTLGGLASASAGVNALSYLSIISINDQSRSKYFAVYVTMQSVGAAIGFLIGGMIGDISVRVTFITQVVGLLICAFSMLFAVKEAVIPQKQAKLTISDVNPLKTLTTSFGLIDKNMKLFLFVVFLAMLAMSANDTYFNYFLMDQLHFPPSANGAFKAAVGVIAIVANSTINLWIISHTNMRKSTVTVLSMCAVALLGVVFISGVPVFLGCALAYYTFSVILMPLLQTLAMHSSAEVGTGVASGLFNSIAAFGRGFGPSMAAFVYGINPRGPFVLAAVFYAFAAIVALRNMREYRRSETTQ